LMESNRLPSLKRIKGLRDFLGGNG
jgi:hypothetical protein